MHYRYMSNQHLRANIRRLGLSLCACLSGPVGRCCQVQLWGTAGGCINAFRQIRRDYQGCLASHDETRLILMCRAHKFITALPHLSFQIRFFLGPVWRPLTGNPNKKNTGKINLLMYYLKAKKILKRARVNIQRAARLLRCRPKEAHCRNNKILSCFLLNGMSGWQITLKQSARTRVRAPLMHGNFLHAAQRSYLHCTTTGDSDSDL